MSCRVVCGGFVCRVSCAVVCRADLRVRVPVQEVVRVYFTDHTYKSFMVGPEDTVRSLIMQVAKKVQVAPHGHYLLEMTGDGTLSSRYPTPPPCVSCRALTRVVCRVSCANTFVRCGAETKPLTDTDLVQDIKSEWEQGANTAFVFSKEIKVRASLILRVCRVVSCRVVSCRVLSATLDPIRVV